MPDIKLATSDLHKDLLEVENAPKGGSDADKKKRLAITNQLRIEKKRDGRSAKDFPRISQKGDRIFVALNEAAQKAIPTATRGMKLSDRIAAAKK